MLAEAALRSGSRSGGLERSPSLRAASARKKSCLRHKNLDRSCETHACEDVWHKHSENRRAGGGLIEGHALRGGVRGDRADRVPHELLLLAVDGPGVPHPRVTLADRLRLRAEGRVTAKGM